MVFGFYVISLSLDQDTNQLLKTTEYGTKVYTDGKRNWGLFGLTISITQFIVFITPNSKMVGLIAKRLFGK